MQKPKRIPNLTNPCTRQGGFTLIELLVAVSIMSVMAIMGWRALDGMQRSSTQARSYTDAVLTLDAGLSQWAADLESLQELPHTSAMDWNGRVLRITRRHAADPSEGLLVVAWTRDERDGDHPWLRWQSNPVKTRDAWDTAWRTAQAWALNQNQAEHAKEIAIAPLEDWQIYFFRGGAWSNALSSAGSADATGATPGAAPATPATTNDPLPDGVRLVLTLPANHPLAGTLTRDWARSNGVGGSP